MGRRAAGFCLRFFFFFISCPVYTPIQSAAGCCRCRRRRVVRHASLTPVSRLRCLGQATLYVVVPFQYPEFRDLVFLSLSSGGELLVSPSLQFYFYFLFFFFFLSFFCSFAGNPLIHRWACLTSNQPSLGDAGRRDRSEVQFSRRCNGTRFLVSVNSLLHSGRRGTKPECNCRISVCHGQRRVSTSLA